MKMQLFKKKIKTAINSDLSLHNVKEIVNAFFFFLHCTQLPLITRKNTIVLSSEHSPVHLHAHMFTHSHTLSHTHTHIFQES